MRETKLKLFDQVYNERVVNTLERDIEKWRKEMREKDISIIFENVQLAFFSNKVIIMILYHEETISKE